MPGAGAGILKKAFISYRGVSDALGTALTIRCAALAALPDFNNQSVVILDGPCRGQSRDISGVTTGGVITVGTAFCAVITAEIHFLILTYKPATAEVAGLLANQVLIKDGGAGTWVNADSLHDIKANQKGTDNALLAADYTAPDNAGIGNVETQTDKLAGADVDTQTGPLDLNAGEQTIFTIATVTRLKIHMAVVSMKNCTATAKITVRGYLVINGVEEKFYQQDFTQGTDPDAIMWLNGTLAVTGNVRCTMQSDNGGDNAVVVPYQYVTEQME